MENCNSFESLDASFKWVLGEVIHSGRVCSPRSKATIELTPFSFSIRNPRFRYVSIPERRWSIVYAIGELCWHLRASQSLDEISEYASKWRSFISGDQVLGSCYGAKIFLEQQEGISQWDSVYKALRSDPDSRRAVLNFNSLDSDISNDSSDIACALSLQFLVRDNRLDAICTMRSNDAMLGMPYDVFFFTMLQEMMACRLGVELGIYHHHVGSLHIYEKDMDLAKKIALSQPSIFEPMEEMKDLNDLSVFLRGERDGCFRRLEAETYWGQLLSVINKWKGFEVGGSHPDLQNEVLHKLFLLR